MKERQHIVFPFDEHKTLAIAEYLLRRMGGMNNYMYLLKLIFFADRYHIRKYLRPATSDNYFAMERGPVASYLYDIFKGSRGGDIFIPIGNYNIQLSNDQPKYRDELSESDIEAIDFSLSNFAQYGEFSLVDISHAYPEWKQYAALFNTKQTKRVEMYFEHFLLNADPKDPNFIKFGITDPFPPILEDERVMMEDEIIELCSQII